jgi:hypothetical protein
MSVTLTPVSSTVYSSAYSPIYSPVYSSVYSASTDLPYVKTSLPVDFNNRDVVITSDYPLMFNRDKDQNLAISPITYPYTNPYFYPYTNPGIVVPYENLNRNKDVINRLVKYYYYKTLDKWLYDDINGLLRYLKVSGNKVHVIKSEDDRDKDISQEDCDKKIQYIEDEIFSKDDMYDILMKIQQETDIELIKLSKNEFVVIGYIKKWFKRHFQKMMSK